MPCEMRAVVRFFFLEDLRVCMKGICFSRSGMCESPTHSCKVQWDCCLISVQLSSQIRKSLADKGTHQNKWLMKGRALMPFIWNPAYFILSINLCVFPNQRKFCQQKMTKIDWLLSNYGSRSLPWHLRNNPQDWLWDLSCCFCKPSLPPWLSQWTVTLVSGLQQRLKCFLLLQEVTPSSPKAFSYKHIYFDNFSGIGSSPSELPFWNLSSCTN